MIHYNDGVVLSRHTSTSKTSNCGWYGCRVMQANDREVAVDHGGSRNSDRPSYKTRFFVRTRDSAKRNKCLAYGDEVYLAHTKETHKTSNCGYFGCRVLQTAKASGTELKIHHGNTAQPFMLLHPTRPAETKGDCVTWGRASVSCWERRLPLSGVVWCTITSASTTRNGH